MEAPPPAAVTAGWSGRHAVELYVRTYSTMLQSSGEIRVESLVHAHLNMGSALHPLAAEPQMDMGAFIYSMRRLPPVMGGAHRIILGQSAHGIQAVLGIDVEGWDRVKAPARRRPWYHDGRGTLAVLLASPTDIDDLVPSLVAYQIEWNKLHRLVNEVGQDSEQVRIAASATEDDWARLGEAWEGDVAAMIEEVGRRVCQMRVRMVGGSHIGYARGASLWWQPIQAAIDEMGLHDAPVYFVSSNLHSLVNVLSGIARRFEPDIVDHVTRTDPVLTGELRKLESGETSASRDNWLYFAARRLFDGHAEAARYRGERARLERQVGIRHVAAQAMGVDSAAQVVKLGDLDRGCLDPRVGRVDERALRASRAAIVNIDYPLGLGAYHILRQVAEAVPRLQGIYVMGKAATLNADVGDVMISNAVYDEHSGNIYWLDNCFAAADVQPHLVFGSALDNQRTVTVRGSFLQNRDYLEFYYQGRYTVVEMEAGPFLDACYEVHEPGRHPMNDNVNMSRLGFDLGIIHYASDTPYTQARTLGARGLDYRGMDSTYASAIAVARRILQQEQALA